MEAVLAKLDLTLTDLDSRSVAAPWQFKRVAELVGHLRRQFLQDYGQLV